MAVNRMPAPTVFGRIYALILVFVAGLLLLAYVAVADLQDEVEQFIAKVRTA